MNYLLNYSFYFDLLTSRAIDILFFDLFVRGQKNMFIAWEVKRSKKEVKTINRKNAEQVLYDFVD